MRGPHCLVNPFQCYRNRSLKQPVTFRHPVSRRMGGIGPPSLLSVNGSGLKKPWTLRRRRIAACRRASGVSGRWSREAPSTPRTEMVVDQGRVSKNAYFRTGIHGRRNDTPHSTPGETELRTLSRARRVVDPLKQVGWQQLFPSCYLLPVETKWSFKSRKMMVPTTIWMAASKAALH